MEKLVANLATVLILVTAFGVWLLWKTWTKK